MGLNHHVGSTLQSQQRHKLQQKLICPVKHRPHPELLSQLQQGAHLQLNEALYCKKHLTMCLAKNQLRNPFHWLTQKLALWPSSSKKTVLLS